MTEDTSPPAELNTSGKDFYETLGLSRNATAEEITQRYRKLAIKYHPDRNPDGAEQFVELKRIYDILSDKRKKAIYDQYGETAAEMYDKYDGSAALDVLTDARQLGTAFLVFSLLLSLCLMFVIFVAVRVDMQVTWNYFLVAMPLWIIDLLLVATAVGVTVRWALSRKEERSKEDSEFAEKQKEFSRQYRIESFMNVMSWWIAIPLVIVFQIMILFKAQGTLSWSWAKIFIFWWLVEGEIAIKKSIRLTRDILARHLYLKQQTSTETSNHHAGLEFFCLKQNIAIFFVFRAVKQFFWCAIRIWFSIFIVLQSDNIVQWNWAVVFLPLFVGFGCYFIIGLWVYDSVRISFATDDKEKERIRMIQSGLSVILFVVFTLVLATFGMFIVRENGTVFYRMVTVFIPIYVLFSIALCCCCCVLPCAMALMTKQDQNIHFSDSKHHDSEKPKENSEKQRHFIGHQKENQNSV